MFSKKLLTRIALFLATYCAVLTLPWWISVPILIGLTLYFDVFIEIIFFGFMYDILYSKQLVFPYSGLISAVVFLSSLLWIRTYIRR